jgi:hypothetical protein
VFSAANEIVAEASTRIAVSATTRGNMDVSRAATASVFVSADFGGFLRGDREFDDVVLGFDHFEDGFFDDGECR